jgi:hypothetical protein
MVRGCVQGESDVQTFLPRLIAIYRAGKLPIERLVRHYPHAAINDAVADMLAGNTIKAVLQIDTASFPPSQQATDEGMEVRVLACPPVGPAIYSQGRGFRSCTPTVLTLQCRVSSLAVDIQNDSVAESLHWNGTAYVGEAIMITRRMFRTLLAGMAGVVAATR